MKFGFIANPADMEQMKMLKVVEAINSFHQWTNEKNESSKSIMKDDTIDLFTLSKIISLNGCSCEGKIKCIPLLHHEMLENQTESLKRIIEAARELEEWGAEIIGLGGVTGIVGSRGKEVQASLSSSRVTTGNSFTVCASLATLDNILSRLEMNLHDQKVVVIGFPGSIGLAIAKILAKRGVDLVLVGRKSAKHVQEFVEMIEGLYGVKVKFCNYINEGIEKGRIIFSATSTGQIINQKILLPGSIVIDIAEPRDVIGTRPERLDVLIAEGGRFNISTAVFSEGVLGHFLRNHLYGCLGETILLALENRKENFSIGRELDIDKIEEIGHIGYKHGCVFDVFYSFGRSVGEDIFNNFRKMQFEKSRKGLISIEKALESTKEEVYARCSNHINPVLTAMSKFGNFDRTYVKAEGIYLWDVDGKKYYDFMGGYGSVNIGHNHPRVIETLQKLFYRKLPSLLQVSPGILTSALAENLSMITPENLDFVFFCNSGTEAVEGALKIARLYTGRSKLVYTDNSFHGKTFGSLSVTGRRKYQEFFEPLLPGCISVPYGEIEPLHELLKKEDVAAFIVEPIQGEGGVIIPPSGYLKEAEELCKSYKTLMILDEVQTGFGRTGKMFVAEHDDLQPDIMTLAKSLGGSMLPIGAYITTKEIWEKTYGNYDRFLLHSSTFGGNNISAAVGIATIQVIYEEKLIENAKNMGAYFLTRLKDLEKKYEFISEVRGRGLMIGIEFHNTLQGGVSKLQNEIMGMLPIEIISIFKMMPEIRKALNEIVEKAEKTFEDIFCRRISSKLLNDYNIITSSTLNNPNVMRIQPPLSVSKDQIDYFVDSLDRICQMYGVG